MVLVSVITILNSSMFQKYHFVGTSLSYLPIEPDSISWNRVANKNKQNYGPAIHPVALTQNRRRQRNDPSHYYLIEKYLHTLPILFCSCQLLDAAYCLLIPRARRSFYNPVLSFVSSSPIRHSIISIIVRQPPQISCFSPIPYGK